jgi:hypothetical protein
VDYVLVHCSGINKIYNNFIGVWRLIGSQESTELLGKSHFVGENACDLKLLSARNSLSI